MVIPLSEYCLRYGKENSPILNEFPDKKNPPGPFSEKEARGQLLLARFGF